jgi:hypothetical protein
VKVFVFDLLAYGKQLEHLKVGSELPYPLEKKYFKPEVARHALMPSTLQPGRSSIAWAMTVSGSMSITARLMG